MATAEHQLQTSNIQSQIEQHRVDSHYLLYVDAWGWDRVQPYVACFSQLDENPLHIAQAIIHVNNTRPLADQSELHFQYPHEKTYMPYVFDRISGIIVYAGTKRDDVLMGHGNQFAADMNAIIGVLMQ